MGDVEFLALVAEAEVAADDGSRGRLEVVAADRGVDQQADLVRVDAGVGQRLHAGERRRVGGLHALVPQAPGVDAGDVLEHVGLDAEAVEGGLEPRVDRSEEHTSELQSLMRISYAVFCLKKKKN